MKRSIAILLTVCLLCGLVFTLTACGEDAAAPASTPDASAKTQETASAAQDAPAAPLPADEKSPLSRKRLSWRMLRKKHQTKSLPPRPRWKQR